MTRVPTTRLARTTPTISPELTPAVGAEAEPEREDSLGIGVSLLGGKVDELWVISEER